MNMCGKKKKCKKKNERAIILNICRWAACKEEQTNVLIFLFPAFQTTKYFQHLLSVCWHAVKPIFRPVKFWFIRRLFRLILPLFLCLWVRRAEPPFTAAKLRPITFGSSFFFFLNIYMLHLFTFDELCSCTNLWGQTPGSWWALLLVNLPRDTCFLFVLVFLVPVLNY